MSSKRKIKGCKICPECGGAMNMNHISNIIDGVSYLKNILECAECGFSDSSYKKRKDKKTIKNMLID